MFTGIITDIGTVETLTPLDEGVKLRIATAYDPTGIDIGALDRLFGRLPDRHLFA